MNLKKNSKKSLDVYWKKELFQNRLCTHPREQQSCKIDGSDRHLIFLSTEKKSQAMSCHVIDEMSSATVVDQY